MIDLSKDDAPEGIDPILYQELKMLAIAYFLMHCVRVVDDRPEELTP